MFLQHAFYCPVCYCSLLNLKCWVMCLTEKHCGKVWQFKMAARSFLRAASLCRRNLAVSSPLARRQSIFTRYREPPNGFLFNEKVTCFVVAFDRSSRAAKHETTKQNHQNGTKPPKQSNETSETTKTKAPKQAERQI